MRHSKPARLRHSGGHDFRMSLIEFTFREPQGDITLLILTDKCHAVQRTPLERHSKPARLRHSGGHDERKLFFMNSPFESLSEGVLWIG